MFFSLIHTQTLVVTSHESDIFCLSTLFMFGLLRGIGATPTQMTQDFLAINTHMDYTLPLCEVTSIQKFG